MSTTTHDSPEARFEHAYGACHYCGGEARRGECPVCPGADPTPPPQAVRDIPCVIVGGCGPRGFYEYERGSVELPLANTRSLERAIRAGGVVAAAAMAEVLRRSPVVLGGRGDFIEVTTEDSGVYAARTGNQQDNPTGRVLLVPRAAAEAMGLPLPTWPAGVRAPERWSA